ncbi:MAG: hypothetical protein ACSLFR_06725 [Solirubrobacteraceae bacterium]
MLEVVFVVVGVWMVLTMGALALASGIGAAAASADRNARRLLRVKHATAPSVPGAGFTGRR